MGIFACDMRSRDGQRATGLRPTVPLCRCDVVPITVLACCADVAANERDASS